MKDKARREEERCTEMDKCCSFVVLIFPLTD